MQLVSSFCSWYPQPVMFTVKGLAFSSKQIKYILHLDQKAAKCKTCKWLYGKF